MSLLSQELKKIQPQATNTVVNTPINTSSYSATALTFNQTTNTNIYEEVYGSTDSYTGYNRANDAAKDLFKNGGGLYDRRITDNSGKIERNLIQNDKWRVDVRKDVNNDGKIDNNDIVDLNNDGQISDEEMDSNLESKTLLETIVDSFDSELDLYIEEQFQQVIEKYGPSCTYNLRAMFGSPNSPAVIELARLGIRADAIGDHDVWQNRTYAFSLVNMEGTENMTDEELLAHVYSPDAEILQDAQGNKGSIVFADCLTADGTAQGAEMNLSSILDQMGYECVSKADFMGKEQEYQELLQNIKTGLDNNLYESSNATINAIYGRTLTMSQAVCAVYGINGHAYGVEGWHCKARTFDQTANAIKALGDSLYHLSCGKIDLDGDGVISEAEILKAIESTNNPSEATEKDKKDSKAKGAIIVDNSDTQASATGVSAIDMAKLYSDAEKEFELRLEEENRENPEASEKEIAKEIAKEFGVDEDTLLYNFKH